MKYHQTKLLFLSILIVSFLFPLNCIKTGILISTKAIQVVSNYSKELCHISHQIEPKTTKAVKNVINSMSRLSDYNFHEFKHMVNGDRVDTIFALQGHLIINTIQIIPMQEATIKEIIVTLPPKCLKQKKNIIQCQNLILPS